MLTLLWSKIGGGKAAYHAAYVDAGRNTGWVRHRHDYHEVFRVESGIGWHWLEATGREKRLEAGQVFFIRPRDGHGFRAEASSEPFAFVNIAFPAPVWKELEERYGWGGGGLWDMKTMEPVAHQADETGERVVAEAFRELLQVAPERRTLDWFLLTLDRVFSGERESSSGADAPAWMRRAMAAFVRGEGGLAGGPDELAALAGCSPAHLSRCFRRALNKTPTEWILGLRLRRAGRLLAATGYSISEVAAMSGFENLSNFHRRFRAAYGHTPLAYRRQHRRAVA